MPSEFQKAMDCTLQGIPGTICYLDDILVVSKGTLSQHTEIVHKVLSRLDEEGLALKLSKCEFAVDKLDWLGFDIHSSDYAPKFPKIEAVRPPSSVYDELFVIKTIENFTQTCNSIRAGAWVPSAELIDLTFVSSTSRGRTFILSSFRPIRIVH